MNTTHSRIGSSRLHSVIELRENENIHRIARGGMIMKMLAALAITATLSLGVTGVSAAQEVTVTAKGISWDADSSGFGWYQGLGKKKRTEKAARVGSRISLDGQPDKFAVTAPGGKFELTFKTSQPTFRLIAEGDRFPRTITQPIEVPEGGGTVEVGRVSAPRGEGAEHTWPLQMAAELLGYASSHEMLADNKAAIRFGAWGSGAPGAPDFANDSTISFPNEAQNMSKAESTTTSPYLMRIQQPQYVFPYDMDKQNTFFQFTGPRLGAFMIIVPFVPGDGTDKGVTIQINDTVTDETLDPPRPWHYEPKTVWVRNGFATVVGYEPDID